MSRWIIVSNRLPFHWDETREKLTQSGGGLVTAINGVKSKKPMHWIGSLDHNIPENLVKTYKSKDKTTFSYPKISKNLYDSYYNDFCNDVLWPLFHYESELVRFEETHWKSYVEVNQRFADHISKVAKADDLIWIHDFHLFLVPKFLKKINKNLKVGFFLHIPFPSSEIYKQLPCRKEILDALIYSDIVGFHDFSYLRHFASSVYSILGISYNLMELQGPLNKIKLGVYPVSIDTENFIRVAKSAKTELEIKRNKLNQNKIKTILAVERLDYSKGILLKLRTFKMFLETYPKYVGKIQLYQIAVPSRTQVQDYINLRHEVEMLVSEINGRFSKLNYVPVKYFFTSINMNELMALYRTSEILFVTSKRDGMNLVCLEYIAAQNLRNPGVIMLSEFTGAASTLSHATLVNPFNIGDSVRILKESLEKPLVERKENHKVMLDYLKHYTASTWANSFLEDLNSQGRTGVVQKVNLETKDNLNKVKGRIKNKSTTFLLDYDGTLSPIVSRPELALINQKTKQLLTTLSQRKNTDVVVVTGRDKKFISQQLKGLKVYIACEHGASFYDHQKKVWRNLAPSKRRVWFEHAIDIISQYQKRTPNSFIEKKNYGIAWHYRNSPDAFAEFQARKLVQDLESDLSKFPVNVSRGKKVVEVKSVEANKGYFVDWFLSRYIQKETEVVAIGDDKTDEDMFRYLMNRGITIKVGDPKDTFAQFYIPEQDNVLKTLKNMTL
ncbi:bifunctional alpha,alpha-trehalose-phosphate synthase (UDP-forming)/trehalose-phosphatase [Bacteriovoracaceae bacterium]|nr:bifunctional alpha,alpha-trehalose-phosphate synthase (UDP-forming)/trehalose-phosphatase [Bacteriovoracaceae bacterium]